MSSENLRKNDRENKKCTSLILCLKDNMSRKKNLILKTWKLTSIFRAENEGRENLTAAETFLKEEEVISWWNGEVKQLPNNDDSIKLYILLVSYIQSSSLDIWNLYIYKIQEIIIYYKCQEGWDYCISSEISNGFW